MSSVLGDGRWRTRLAGFALVLALAAAACASGDRGAADDASSAPPRSTATEEGAQEPPGSDVAAAHRYDEREGDVLLTTLNVALSRNSPC